MAQVVTDSLWNLNLYRWLIGWFSVLTLLLSAVGLYGVVSHVVTSRRREWAVRLALGSPSAKVARLVVMRGLALAAIGVAAGIVIIVLAITSLRSGFPGIASSASAATLATVAAAMFSIALGASWLPALRVARIAPSVSLRAE